jgi:small nuclear ribonucleoprotein (snRNP)-like protein
MSGQKVVIKYKDGKIIKGWLNNFNPNREIFFVNPLKEYSDKLKIDVNINDLKAIFFVKDFIGDKDYQKVRTFEDHNLDTPSQRRIIVHFKDGEDLYGTSYSYNPIKTGFFVYPIDSMDNNIRIFAINLAVEKVEFPDSSDESFNF